MDAKEQKAKLRDIEKALKEFPKIVKQKEKAFKEKQKILKNFEPFARKLKKQIDAENKKKPTRS